MHTQCAIERLPHRHTMTVRFRCRVGELPANLAAAHSKVGRLLSDKGAKASGPPFAIYHAIDPSEVDVEAGYAVDRPLSGGGDVQLGEIPGGRTATILHTGPRGSVGLAYDALVNWLEEQGLEPKGEPCELYLDDPQSTAAEQLRTKVTMPIGERGTSRLVRLTQIVCEENY
jgi:effector-binding domain-containing protein